jgi:hypothetical protein
VSELTIDRIGQTSMAVWKGHGALTRPADF